MERKAPEFIIFSSQACEWTQTGDMHIYVLYQDEILQCFCANRVEISLWMGSEDDPLNCRRSSIDTVLVDDHYWPVFASATRVEITCEWEAILSEMRSPTSHKKIFSPAAWPGTHAIGPGSITPTAPARLARNTSAFSQVSMWFHSFFSFSLQKKCFLTTS